MRQSTRGGVPSLRYLLEVGRRRGAEVAGAPRGRHKRRRRSRGSQLTYDDIVLLLDRELVAVGVECNAFERALTSGDLGAAERAAYALASAWFLAEASAMRILGESPGIGACRRFARQAIIASSGVVTALYGQALAETLRWAALVPKPPGLGRLRTVLGQLAARVDVRQADPRRVREPESRHRPEWSAGQQ